MLIRHSLSSIFFFFNDTATTEIYTLSLHDALPIYQPEWHTYWKNAGDSGLATERSEEHTSELQSRLHLVCRLLLEKKKKKKQLSNDEVLITEIRDVTQIPSRTHSVSKCTRKSTLRR